MIVVHSQLYLLIMKPIFKVLLLLLTLSLICQCERDESNPSVNIPDKNFLNALIKLGVDTDRDREINKKEAQEITYLDVMGHNISDLTGIEGFINLDTLWCCGNQLTNLDVSRNIALITFGCRNNQLTNLDVTNNTFLETLCCGGNALTSLDVSNCHALKLLDIRNMPTLYEVCVHTMPFPSNIVAVLWDFSPNVYFTTDCSN